MKYRAPLDTYDKLPEDMQTYLRHNGWHFNKKMVEFATEHMKKDGQRIEPWSNEEVASMIKANGITLKEPINSDHAFVANMAKADFYGSSLPDEASIANFVKDYTEDEDQADGFILNRFYADCVRNGIRIPWEEMV